jgi:hypothetical protein
VLTILILLKENAKTFFQLSANEGVKIEGEKSG